jgi:cell division control protein 45
LRVASRSIFGQAFDNAAEQSKAKAQSKYFDASVVEVRKGDFTKFLVSSAHLSSGFTSAHFLVYF